MGVVWLRVLRLLTCHDQGFDPVLVDQIWLLSVSLLSREILNSLFNRDFNFIVFTRVNVSMNLDSSRLPGRAGEKSEVAEFVGRVRLVLLLVHDCG